MKTVDLVDCINEQRELNEKYGLGDSNYEILENAKFEFNKIVKAAKEDAELGLIKIISITETEITFKRN
jgi:hypothetical protein